MMKLVGSSTDATTCAGVRCLLQRTEKALTAWFFKAAGRSGCPPAHWAAMHAGCCQCCCCALVALCCLGGVGGADIGLAPLALKHTESPTFWLYRCLEHCLPLLRLAWCELHEQLLRLHAPLHVGLRIILGQFHPILIPLLYLPSQTSCLQRRSGV